MVKPTPLLLVLLVLVLATFVSARPPVPSGFLGIPSLTPTKVPYISSEESVLPQIKEFDGSLEDGRRVKYMHHVHTQPNVVGLDLEESVTDVQCSGDDVTITGTSLADLQAWVVGSKLVFSSHWGCTFESTSGQEVQSHFRKVTAVVGPSAVVGSTDFAVTFTTVPATFGEVFNRFKVSFSITPGDDDSDDSRRGEASTRFTYAPGPVSYTPGVGFVVSCSSCSLTLQASIEYDLDIEAEWYWPVPKVNSYKVVMGGEADLNLPLNFALTDYSGSTKTTLGPKVPFFDLAPFSVFAIAIDVHFDAQLGLTVDANLKSKGSVDVGMAFSPQISAGIAYTSDSGMSFQNSASLPSTFTVTPRESFTTTGDLTFGVGPILTCTTSVAGGLATFPMEASLYFKAQIPFSVGASGSGCAVKYSMNGFIDLDLFAGVISVWGLGDFTLDNWLPLSKAVSVLTSRPLTCSLCSGCLFSEESRDLVAVDPISSSASNHLGLGLGIAFGLVGSLVGFGLTVFIYLRWKSAKERKADKLTTGLLSDY